MPPLRTTVIASIVASTSFALAANMPGNANVVVCQANTGCIHHTIFGHDYKILTTDRVTVMVTLSNEGRYTRADVSITNLSHTPINLSPEDFRIQALTPHARVFPYVPPSQIEDIPTPTRVVYSPPNPPVSELEAARQRAAQEAAELSAAAPLLQAITIPPNQAVHGRVYFERDPGTTFQQVNVVLPIGGTVFKFPDVIKP